MSEPTLDVYYYVRDPTGLQYMTRSPSDDHVILERWYREDLVQRQIKNTRVEALREAAETLKQAHLLLAEIKGKAR